MFSKLFFKHLRTAQRVLEVAIWALQGGTACFGSCFLNTFGRHSVFEDLFFEHLRAARRVLGSGFLNTLRRHSVF